MAYKSITLCALYFTYEYDEYSECVFCGLKPKVNHKLQIFEPQKKN